MSNETIGQILKAHLINYKIDEAGHIFSEEVYTLNRRVYSEWINVTGWSYDKLYAWLGY